MSTAVAKQTDQGGAVSVKVEVGLQTMIEKFEKVLPTDIVAERFCRVAINAMQDDRIQEAAQTAEGRQSIYTECLVAATDGLLLDKREAFLNVYSTKVKVGNREEYRKLAKYMPMYQGLMKLARNGGAEIRCQIVKRGDFFKVTPTADGCPVEHEWAEDLSQRGEMVAVYAVAQFKDGMWSNVEVMTPADVEKIRQGSPAKDKDAWRNHFGEMARKTVIRRLVKYLPKSNDSLERLANASQRDGQLPAIDHAAAPALSAPRKTPRAAELLGHTPEPAAAPVAEVLPPEKKEKAEAKPKKAESKPAAKKRDDGPPPREDDDPGPGGDGVWEDPMTGEAAGDDDGI